MSQTQTIIDYLGAMAQRAGAQKDKYEQRGYTRMTAYYTATKNELDSEIIRLRASQ